MSTPAERLEELSKGMEPGALPGTGEEIPDIELAPEEAAQIVIDYANQFCKESGLKPMNAIQTFLIRVGAVGTCKKHGITLNPRKYPELALGLGLSWTALEKVKEYKALKAKKETAAPPAEDGERGPEAEKELGVGAQ